VPKLLTILLTIFLSTETSAENIVIKGWGALKVSSSGCNYDAEVMDQGRQITFGNRVFDFKETYRPLVTSPLKDGKYDFLYISDSERIIHGTIYSGLYRFVDLSKEIDSALKGSSDDFILTQVFNPGLSSVLRNSDFIHVETQGKNGATTVIVYQSGGSHDIVKLRISPSINCDFSFEKNL